jgi:hypothetical protein
MDVRSLYVLAATIFLSADAQLLQPPAIIRSPSASPIYFTQNVGETLLLPCVAIGNPKPNYEWRMNDKTLSITPKEDGTIEITSLSLANQGTYQCFARNSEGVAMSNKTQVILASQATFPAPGDPYRVTASIGLPLTLPCSPSFRGVPLPRATAKEYNWRSDQTPLTVSKRIQIDDNGNLKFSAVTKDDISTTAIWTCYITNSYLVVEAGGSPTMIVPSTSTPAPPNSLSIMFYTNQTLNSGSSVVVGLEGRNVSLRCFFSGSESISITWRRTDGGAIPTDGRVLQLNFNVELRITNAQKSDEGAYACTASSSGFASVDFPFDLRIHAVPKFQIPADGPRNYNASVGEYVKVNCSAYAIPAATVQWFKNGDPIDPMNPPSKKFQFSDDLKTLTFGPLCKDNCSGRNDLMVLQCNASNTYGYVLGNGYINVFVRTNFTFKSENLTLGNQELISFKAKAVSDPHTPLTYTWYRSGKQIDCGADWCKVYNVTNNVIIISGDDSELTIYNPKSQDAGDYKCVASNGVSSDVAAFALIEPPAVAYVWPFWWIPFIILLIAVLTIIIVFLVCCYLYRNRGDEYPVDEKERQADRNPEKELVDSGFHDYQRPARPHYDEERQPLHM